MADTQTPGPWTVRELENFGFNVVHYIGGDRHDLARVAKCASEADAALVARAPDLLAENERLRAALTGLLDSCGARRRYHALDYAAAVEKAEAALSEQEGKPAKDVGREGAFRAGYKAGFDAAKHPFHMPVADEAFAFFSEQEGE